MTITNIEKIINLRNFFICQIYNYIYIYIYNEALENYWAPFP